MTNHRSPTVNRKHADGIVALVLAAILLLGGIATWQAYRQWMALNQVSGHMGMDATAVHSTHPVWYLFATIVAVVVIGGIYLGVRDRLGSSPVHSPAAIQSTDEPVQTAPANEIPEKQRAPVEGAIHRRILDLLPDDERQILKPVLESPGLTQIKLRDRSDFSKSKVSQTVTALEKRGLLYREPQGRTYRIYPSEELSSEQ